MRAYLIKKQQFNNLILIKSKTTHGSVILSMDKLRSNSNLIAKFIEANQVAILNKSGLEGAVVRLGEYDRIPMYAVAMPPLFVYRVGVPDLKCLKSILVGLLETFPSYSQDFFIYYLYMKEGVKNSYTATQVSRIALKHNEKPIPGKVMERLSSGLCDSDDLFSDKENTTPNTKHSPIVKKQVKVQFNSILAKEIIEHKDVKYEDLSDLDKESVIDVLGQRKSYLSNERVKQDIGNELYCSEDINDVFKFNSFAS
jgi:hypothetical protein